MIARPALIAICLLLAGCLGQGQRADEGVIEASVIGGAPQLADPSRSALNGASRVLMGATAQGLVRFDASGQVEPALAERWIVIGDGTSYIFRLRDARWSNGKPVTAEAVVARLRAAARPGSRNPMRDYLSAIDEIVVMTPQVIEIRLSSPRPELLRLLAQPELALFDVPSLTGSGPMRLASRDGGVVRLEPVSDNDEAEAASADPRNTVLLRGERAARAVARFAQQRSDLVMGGTYADRPIVDVSSVAPANIRVEAVAGLFGLAVVEREGLLADAEFRAALAMAIDRETLARLLGDSWRAETRILPARYESAAAPAEAGWSALSLADRRAAARQVVARLASANAPLPPLRIALPEGPGSRLVFSRLTADFSAIGVPVARVGMDQDADLRLIDAVAPHDNARWFLANACRPCGEPAVAALEAARTAPDMVQRGARLAEADALIAGDQPFIPLAQPVRWSLVSLRLRDWTTNPRAVHPLNRLRRGTN